MQFSDNEGSDDEKKRFTTKPNTSSLTASHSNTLRKVSNLPVRVKPVNRARPVSAAVFKDVSTSDSELKVYMHPVSKTFLDLLLIAPVLGSLSTY